MDLYLLDELGSNYEPLAVIEGYKSLIWTKKYYTHGDFELYVPADEKIMNLMQPYRILQRDDDDESAMLIEKMNLKTDAENGDFCIFSGRSLESIFSYRVIAWQTNINNLNPVAAIKSLIEMNQSYRRLDGLVIDDSLIISETMSTQYTGDNLLSVIEEICKRFKFGFKTAISGNNIILSFYKGTQKNVIFSPEFDNLISSEYMTDFTNCANFAYIAGEGEGNFRKWAGIGPDSGNFYKLREMFVDARDISSKTSGGELSADEYRKKLVERGYEKLAEKNITKSFAAEIDPNGIFKYKQDYNLGDIVTVANGYGAEIKPRITEITEAWDENGYTVVPTFEQEQGA